MLSEILELIKGVLPKAVTNGGYTQVDTAHAIRTLLPGPSPFKSLSARAAESITYWPLLVSESLPVETVAILARAVERQRAEMIRIVISNDEIIDLDKSGSKSSMIDRFRGIALHDADKSDADVGFTAGKKMDSIHKAGLMMNADVAAYIVDHGHELVLEDMTPVDDGLNPRPLSEARNKMPAVLIPFMPGNHPRPRAIQLPTQKKTAAQIAAANKPSDKSDKLTYPAIILPVAAKGGAQGLAPLTVAVPTVYKSGDTMIERTIVVAVKAVVHVVPSNEVIDQLATSMRDNKAVFRLVQWTTGEIAFWKDLVLNIDKIRLDIATSKTGSWFWRLRASALNATLGLAIGKQHLLPTTTLVVTLDEVAEVKRTCGIDLMRGSEAGKLTKLFHLTEFMVVDMPTETLWRFDENLRRYDRTTLPTEDRDNKNLAPKDLMKILTGVVNTGGAR